jgi:hypothetical protein
MDSGKEKGYALYDEVNELVTEDFQSTGRDLDDVLSEFDAAGVEILEEPKIEFDKKTDEVEEFGDLELPTDIAEKTNDPVRMYLREMGTVPLLTRDGEIELAKRIARGQAAVKKALSRSPIVIREVLSLAEELQAEPEKARDILILPDLMATDEVIAEQLDPVIKEGQKLEKLLQIQMGEAARKAVVFELTGEKIIDAGDKVATKHITQVQKIVQKKLESLKIDVKNAGLQRIPNTTKKLTPLEFQSVMKLIDIIEDDDDVQNVYHNIELTDELLQSLS